MKLVLTAFLAFSSPAFASSPILNIVTESQAPGAVEALLDPQASQGASNDKVYGCSVLSPGMRDSIGRYCSTGYAVSWDGYVLNNTCYYDLNAAYNVMRTARVCNESTSYGACQLVQPSQRDQAQRYCNNAYGVSYYGYIVDNICFQNADSALSKMHSTLACGSYPSMGRCQLMQPGQRDRNGRYCNTAYGVAYDGAIVNNTCYAGLDTAMNLMQTAQYCRY
jgi:hypothetical protein